jgi:hypothetical protein
MRTPSSRSCWSRRCWTTPCSRTSHQKMVTPAARREAVAHLQNEFEVPASAILRADRIRWTTSRRAYSHVHITSFQELLCLLQGVRCRAATKSDATELMVPADQVFQLRRAMQRNHRNDQKQKQERDDHRWHDPVDQAKPRHLTLLSFRRERFVTLSHREMPCEAR